MNVDLYRKLFVHRADVFAEQHEDGHYEPCRFPLDDMAIAEHLEGFASYGVYVIEPESTKRSLATSEPYPRTTNTVKYVVFDLDTYDADALDFLKRAVMRLIGGAAFAWDKPNVHERCLLLEDSGGKGYHVWLFLSEPVAAHTVRAWTEAVRTQYVTLAGTADPPWPALEIFPKQDEVPEGGFGNLVKLPFGVHAKTKARAFLVQVPGWADSLEAVVPFDVGLIPDAPERARASSDVGSSEATAFPCITRILEDGAGQGCRDDAMYHFVRYARAQGVPEDLVSEWAARVNELFDPPLTASVVSTKVRSAFRAGTANPGCNAAWLRRFCPGGSSCSYERKANGGSGSSTSPQPVEADYAFMTPEQRRAARKAKGDN